MNLRENWRILVLVVLLLASTVVLIAPIGGAAGSGGEAGSAATPNLQYGLELSGGTRVRAPLVGLTAEDVAVPATNESHVLTTVVSELGVGRADVRIRPRQAGTADVEVFARNVTSAEFAAALQAAGIDITASDIRQGVTTETREATVDVIERKVNLGGLTGGQVEVVNTATGEKFILVEVPNANRSQVLDLIGERGTVELVAMYPVEGENGTEYRQESVLSQDGIASIQPATTNCGGAPACVPISLTEDDGKRFARRMRATGFTSQEGIQNCQFDANPEDPGYCLLTVTNGEVVYDAAMSSGLAGTIESGDFTKTNEFVITANNISDAQELALNLRAGALPTELAIEERGTTFFLEPSLATEFKLLSLLTGLTAALAVAVTISIRYGRPKVAAPMFVTAMAEVYLLLGFASVVGLALDLSHIAGFIAVIGTGVDDLVIIADEILQRGEIRTNRVFRDRFRKAFWVIGAAALTTIVAMSPLAIISLGDLRGFAIVTIVGVMIGVLLTRPAYGDVLRNLVISSEE